MTAPKSQRNLRQITEHVSTEWIPRYPRRCVAYLQLDGWNRTWVERETEVAALEELYDLLSDYGVTDAERALVRDVIEALKNWGDGFPRGSQL